MLVDEIVVDGCALANEMSGLNNIKISTRPSAFLAFGVLSSSMEHNLKMLTRIYPIKEFTHAKTS